MATEYRISFIMTDKDLRHLVKALKKQGGAISDDLIHMIIGQKESQDKKALKEMCREKRITIDYEKKTYEEVWNGEFE